MSATKLERLKRELKSAVSEEDFELALDVVEDMLGIDDENAHYWNSKGVILSKLGNIDESLEAFDTALEIDTKEPKIWYSKGCVLMDSGKLRASLACFYKALDLDPEFQKALERFNRCLTGMAEAKKAVFREKENAPEEEPEDEEDEEPEEEVDEEAEETAHLIREKRRRKGTFLDDEMFVEEEEGDWDEVDEDEWEDDDYVEPSRVITCKCGHKIPIYTEKRPYRFECDECGRTGTLKK
jgi:tetratricopeptide (TPR) repeat protein